MRAWEYWDGFCPWLWDMWAPWGIAAAVPASWSAVSDTACA